MKKADQSASPCPCGSGARYAQCCVPYHLGESLPPTAQALMRSRYCAYVYDLADYLFDTWHVSTRDPNLHSSLAQEAQQLSTKWLGLTICRAFDGTQADEAFVEFIAKYKVGGAAAQRLHETSRFVYQHGRWWYVDGVFT